ncbi:MAG: WD40/YVTN/BNR-like repeat-containing protein [bacterium]
MHIKHKVKPPVFTCMMTIISFVLLGCEHENALDSNQNQPKEITWQQTALDSLKIVTLAANSTGTVFAGTCGDGIFRSKDLGTTWTRVNNYRAKTIAINADADIFAAIVFGGLIRSTDNGESWTLLNVDVGLSFNFVSIAFNKFGKIFVGSSVSDESRGGIYRSIDKGDTWMQTSFPDSLSALVLAINANGVIFVGTFFGVFRFTDDGETWTQSNSGFRERGVGPFVASLAINPLTGDIFAGVIFDKVYRSEDNGNTWNPTDLTSPNIGTLVINSAGDIFAGSGGYSMDPQGVFYSTDNGKSWSKINRGLTNTYIRTLTVDSSGFVFAGTQGNGVFRTVNSTMQ